MASYNLRYLIQITDINGDTAEVSLPSHLADTTTLAAIATGLGTLATDIAACSNGKVTRQSFRVLVNEAQYLVGTTPPTDAEYSSVTDGARLQFADGAGEKTSLTIPAPVEAIFGANSNVVDSTISQVATLITQVAASANSTSGTAFNLYKGGVKTGRGSRRRATRLIP